MGRESDGRYVVEVGVRWSDLDLFGHVNNTRTLTLLEEARVDWMFVDAVDRGTEGLSRGVVVAGIRIDYRRPITFPGPVSVSMGVTALGAASFTVDYLVHQGAELVVTGSSSLVPIDPQTARPRRLDATERAYLGRFIPAEPVGAVGVRSAARGSATP
ncbi:thioesterase family protein [Nakamurella sp. A5-74]|uniref:Thioesterase family protein n=1 Tax=Nakamurella sp. A5-74 TaxID=3158264 RepID=A0AAU8DTR9_9ACTN